MMYQISHVAGFQQGDSRPTFNIDESYCERVLREWLAKRGLMETALCDDEDSVNGIYQRLERLDWRQIAEFAERNNGVDSVEMFTFGGSFEQIWIPLRFCLDNKKLSPSDKDLCETLLKIYEDLEKLDYA